MPKLTQKEADRLIAMLKKTVKDEIEFPRGKGKVEFDVVGERKKDVFVINIERKGINSQGASYQGRARHGSGSLLLRLDVNPSGVHQNPDGEKMTGTHLHVYSEEHEMRMAVPFDIENKGLYDLCFTFFDKFNIIESPKVNYQSSLEEV
jgi:hypothetical protein